ncbi:MAG: DUF1080 domain-containing protein [Verrucomicrobiota bacterium]
MNSLKTFIVLSLLALFASACSSDPKLAPIFNGENLDGWVAKMPACWSVKDGVLYAKNDPDQKGDILFTEKEYTDFVLQLDFQLGEGRIDSGIFLRDSKEQIQIGESGSLKRDMTALPYIPSLKGYPIQVTTGTEALDQKGWNTLKVEVRGSSYTTWLNGVEVMTYKSDTIAPRGPIGIQVHPKREMSLSFRNISALEL